MRSKKMQLAMKEAALTAATTGANDGEGFVTKDVVAYRLCKTERTVERYMKLKYIPFIKTDHSVLFRWKEVVDQLNRRFGPSADPDQSEQGTPARKPKAPSAPPTADAKEMPAPTQSDAQN